MAERLILAQEVEGSSPSVPVSHIRRLSRLSPLYVGHFQHMRYTMDEAPLDTTKRPMKKGDILSYPVRRGSSLYSVLGIIRDIEPCGDKWHIKVDRPIERRKYFHTTTGEIAGYSSYWNFLMVTLTGDPGRMTIVRGMTLKQFIRLSKVGQRERVLYVQA